VVARTIVTAAWERIKRARETARVHHIHTHSQGCHRRSAGPPRHPARPPTDPFARRQDRRSMASRSATTAAHAAAPPRTPRIRVYASPCRAYHPHRSRRRRGQNARAISHSIFHIVRYTRPERRARAARWKKKISQNHPRRSMLSLLLLLYYIVVFIIAPNGGTNATF